MTTPWGFSCGWVKSTMKLPTLRHKSSHRGVRLFSQQRHCITLRAALCHPCYAIMKMSDMRISLSSQRILPTGFRCPLGTVHFSGTLSRRRNERSKGREIWCIIKVAPISGLYSQSELVLLTRGPEHNNGGHFAALECPRELVQDLRELVAQEWKK